MQLTEEPRRHAETKSVADACVVQALRIAPTRNAEPRAEVQAPVAADHALDLADAPIDLGGGVLDHDLTTLGSDLHVEVLDARRVGVGEQEAGGLAAHCSGDREVVGVARALQVQLDRTRARGADDRCKQRSVHRSVHRNRDVAQYLGQRRFDTPAGFERGGASDVERGRPGDSRTRREQPTRPKRQAAVFEFHLERSDGSYFFLTELEAKTVEADGAAGLAEVTKIDAEIGTQRSRDLGRGLAAQPRSDGRRDVELLERHRHLAVRRGERRDPEFREQRNHAAEAADRTRF